MILLISPAKTLDSSPTTLKEFTQPRFAEKSLQLVDILKKKSARSIKKMMGVSDKLAELNHERYQGFQPSFDPTNSKQAIYTFKGDVYLGLQADTFNKTDLNFAQKHLRILSGLYGVLRPYDLMQEYRLEMGIKLKNKKGKNLYDFWGNSVTEAINADIAESKSKYVVNLASNEYYKAVKSSEIDAKIIDIDFREYRGEQLKFISFSAKKARGMMCHYIIKNKIKKIEDLKGFDYDDYHYDENLSSENSWTFVK